MSRTIKQNDEARIAAVLAVIRDMDGLAEISHITKRSGVPHGSAYTCCYILASRGMVDILPRASGCRFAPSSRHHASSVLAWMATVATGAVVPTRDQTAALALLAEMIQPTKGGAK